MPSASIKELGCSARSCSQDACGQTPRRRAPLEICQSPCSERQPEAQPLRLAGLRPTSPCSPLLPEGALQALPGANTARNVRPAPRLPLPVLQEGRASLCRRSEAQDGRRLPVARHGRGERGRPAERRGAPPLLRGPLSLLRERGSSAISRPGPPRRRARPRRHRKRSHHPRGRPAARTAPPPPAAARPALPLLFKKTPGRRRRRWLGWGVAV